MTKTAIISQLHRVESLAAGAEVGVGNFVISRSKSHHRSYCVRHGSKTICEGEIPTSADPDTFPVRMAIEAVTNMNI